MRPGLWEITMQMEMPGMPMAMPATKVQHCYSASDVADAEKTVPTGQDGENPCRVSDYSLRGNTASWSMQCENMSGKGSMTYSGDSYSGTTELQMQEEGMSQSMKQTISARRVGDCAK